MRKRKMVKRIFCWFMAICMIMPAPTLSAKAAGNYTADWERWSQGASSYNAMQYGCRVTAYAKMLAEAGYTGFGNPDGFFEWGKANGFFRASDTWELKRSAPVTYINSNGGTASVAGEKALTGNKVTDANTVMELINQGYYVVLTCSGHSVYVGRAASISQGTAVVLESLWGVKTGSSIQYRNYTGYTFTTAYYFRIDNKMHLEMTPNSASISNLDDIIFSWNHGSADISGYNLYIAPVIEGSVNYDWENSRIYCPGYNSTQHKILAGGLKNGAYASYVEGVNFTTGEKSQPSNYLYFIVCNHTLKSVTLEINPDLNNIPQNHEITFSWSESDTKASGYNLYVAQYNEEKGDYDWENSRNYVPGYKSLSYTYPSGTFGEGAYAAYVQAINTKNNIISPESNFIWFRISKSDYTLESPLISLATSVNTYKPTDNIKINWTKSTVGTLGYNLYIARYDSSLKNYDWENSRIYLPGYDSTSYTVPPETLKSGQYAAYVEAWNTTDNVKSEKSNFLYFVVEDMHIHEYVGTVEKEASCSKNGTMTYTCICGDSYTVMIEATGHIEITKSYRPATCNVEGYTGDVYCQTCDSILKKGNYIDRIKHSFTNYVSDNNAQIGVDGTKTAYCDYGCGTADTVVDEGSALKSEQPGQEEPENPNPENPEDTELEKPSTEYIYKLNDDKTTISITKCISSDENIVIPSTIDGYTVTEISERAFQNVTSMKTVSFPSTLKTIGDYAFADCISLITVTLPDSLTGLYTYVFKGCISLTSATLNAGQINVTEGLFQGCTSLSSIAMPNTVQNIKEYAFYGCTSLKTLSLPKSLLAVHNNAFLNSGINMIQYAGTSADWKNISISATGNVSLLNAAVTGSDRKTFFANKSKWDTEKPVIKPSVSKVKSFKVKSGKKKFTLRWKKLSGAAGYQIQISTKKNFKGAKTISISKSKKTYTKKSLKANKKYYLRIRAYKTYKDADQKTQKVYGKWTVISKKTK